MTGPDHPAVFPPFARDVPAVTAAQMAEVDRLAMSDYGIDLLQMMENAGGALARVVRKRWPQASHVSVLAGAGGNGGGALAAARRLQAFGRQVSVVLDRPFDDLSPATAHQATTLQAMKIEFCSEPKDVPGTVVVDGLIGYGLEQAPHGRSAELIEWSGGADSVVSVDVPSGVDATTGLTHEPHVIPQVTVTLALPKTGLTTETTGTLLLADIGIPPRLYAQRFLVDTTPIFSRGDIVDLSRARLHPIP